MEISQLPANKPPSIELPSVLRFLRRLPLPHKLGLLERLYGKGLGQLGIVWVETANRVLWKLNLADACQRWIVFGDYEGSTQMSWLRHWLAPGGVVIDSGANIGQMALYLAPLPSVTLFAFEPLPTAADWLDECLRYQPNWSVKVIRQGLSDSIGTLTMQVDGARSTTRSDWYREKGFPCITAPMTTLDSFLEDGQIESVRLWKLDVEGHELAALEGARRHLERKSIAAILVELSDVEGPQRLLGSYGYSLYRIGRRGALERLSGTERAFGNVLALAPGSLP